MTGSPEGWQYPQLPAFPPGRAEPGSVPPRPLAMRRAVSLMYAGAAVGAVSAIVGSVVTHNVTFYTYQSTSASTATVHAASSVVAGIVAALIVTGLWLWMAWKTGAGRNWARVLSTVFFGFACLQLLGAVVAGGGSGGKVLALVLMLVEWSVALAALIQLWQRESGDFFTLAKQARLYRA